MPETCTCGAQLPPDALFCHKCGKPQRNVAPVEPETTVAEPPPFRVAPPPQAPPLNFHNPVAVRIAFVVAMVTALLSWFPLLNIVMWAGAGFSAVFLYRRRTGVLLDVRAGVQMGWITGVLSFAINTVIFTAAIVSGALKGGLASLFQEQLTSVTDPNMREALKVFQSGSGLAFFVVLLLLILFVFTTVLSMAGGALGAKLVGHGR